MATLPSSAHDYNSTTNFSSNFGGLRVVLFGLANRILCAYCCSFFGSWFTFKGHLVCKTNALRSHSPHLLIYSYNFLRIFILFQYTYITRQTHYNGNSKRLRGALCLIIYWWWSNNYYLGDLYQTNFWSESYIIIKNGGRGRQYLTRDLIYSPFWYEYVRRFKKLKTIADEDRMVIERS